MSKAAATPLQRRLARVGGFQLSPTTELSVWAYADVQGAGRQVSIDVHAGGGFFSIELPAGAAQQLEKLLSAGAYMAEIAGEMSADEWARYEAAELKKGGAA
ncbi:hypothetical protein [Comamonas testosteroni]|uniref:hypothetical protein n=1 Tax=Comamonas testosteroni TaxID=285 RepID=UPI0028E539F2|nr:hypothetical protein [Comamonas testosteroni]